jgi:hypothetical protein
MRCSRTLLVVALAGRALSHGGHGSGEKITVPEDADWITRHMAGMTVVLVLIAYFVANLLKPP